MGRLNGKVAIVTGASSGIGRATAMLFAREGGRVVLTARRQEPLDAVAREIADAGGEAIAVAGNVADGSHHATVVAEATRRFGGVDIAVNNAAAMGPLKPSLAVDPMEWRATIDTNLTATFLAAQAQIPAMLTRGGGSLILVGSFVGYTAAFAGMAAYAASKAGLIGLTQALAVEFGGQRVRVNALLPGGTDTPMAREFAPTEEARAQLATLYALKRLATPEEQAESALYLASDASSFVTGHALLVDGGVSILRG
jgi:NAD(P)-dependent dehydrogenase (short-subunit alcohol dehydrogenase family)